MNYSSTRSGAEKMSCCNLGGKFSATPIRCRFTVATMGAALIGGNVRCSFRNFPHAQSMVSAVVGNPLGLSYWASFTIHDDVAHIDPRSRTSHLSFQRKAV